MSNPLQRFPLTQDQITRVMTRFYSAIRVHPELGPVFNGRIGTGTENWQEHEEKIGRFWRNALLREPVYHGNPMQVHLATPEIRDEHFPQWLALFDETLNAELPAETAQAWSALAHRIAQGFRIRISDARRPSGDVPFLG